MKITPEELSQHPLARCYLVNSDEILLVEEALMAIEKKAALLGLQKEVATIESGGDWNKWLQNAKTASFFSPKRLLVCRSSSKLIKESIACALEEYLTCLPSNTAFVFVTQKLEASEQNKRWALAFDEKGVVLRIVAPTSFSAFLGWLQKRLREKGLRLSRNALLVLADFTEGNLLAGANAIEQLSLAYAEAGVLEPKEIEACLQNDARYDIYQLAETCLTSNRARALQILRTLKNTSASPTLVLWAITKELRQIASMAFEYGQKKPLSQILKANRVWARKQPFYKDLLEKNPLSFWQHRLSALAAVDELLKTNQGDFWRVLEDWCYSIDTKGSQYFTL